MADDPRRGGGYSGAEPATSMGPPAKLPSGTVSGCCHGASDPLRVLLADEDRWLDLMAKASVDSHFGAGYWASVPYEWRQAWLSINRERLQAQLAALREEGNR